MDNALQPIVKLFQDRTFVTALISALVAVLVSFVPQLAQFQGQIISLAVLLILLAAGGNVAQSIVETTTNAKTEQKNLELQIAQAQQAKAEAEWKTVKATAASASNG